MSTYQPPDSFEFLLPTFSLPMKAERSRNKERLEASLAGLCELELLKQRQECRVMSALCLGGSTVSGRILWGESRSERCSLDTEKDTALEEHSLSLQSAGLQCVPWDLDTSLQRQVVEMKLNTDDNLAVSSTDLEGILLCSGQVLVDKRHKFPESGYHPLAPCCLLDPEVTETEKGETLISEPKKQVLFDDVLGKMSNTVFSQEDFQQAQKVETYIFGLIQRRVLPTRPSRPRTSMAHDARGVSLVRQVTTPEISNSSKSSEPSAPQVYHDVHQECYPGTGPTDDSPAKYHHHHQESIQHQSGPYHRPRQASRSPLLDYPSFRVLQACPDSSNSEPDSPQYFHCHSPPSLLKAHKPPSLEEQLVKAEYIPAQPCRASTRAYGHHQSNPHRGSVVPKPKQSTYCPERDHHPHPEHKPILSQNQPSRSRGSQKKCSNEDRGAASRKQGKKACRSQSENSLQRVPERKYNTEEKDGGGRGSHSSQSRNKKQRWQSTLELSQDEAERSPMHTPQQGSSASNHKDHCVRRMRKSRPTHASFIPHHSHHHQHIEYQLERVHVHSSQPNEDYPHPGQGDSESSMSEADSPDSSSLSSDSDESGGLVWPQQLAPQNSLGSPPAPPGAPLQPKAFVKIKASHALKKKILRFRTGSLKLMTTV